MNHVMKAASHPHPRLRRFAIDLAITQVFNLIIAVFLSYVVERNSGFLVNLVFSVCIGTLAAACIDGGRLLLWGEKSPGTWPTWRFVLLVAASLPAAHFIGSSLAAFLLGLPWDAVSGMRTLGSAASLIMVAVFSTFIIGFFWSRSHIECLRAEAEAERARAASVEKQALQAQLQMLQAQIEPHMLFNTLANLQGLIAVDPARALYMLEQLIQYLRATLSASRSQTTSLAHEFSLLDAYLGLMQIRMGARLGYALDLPDELHSLNIPPMLLQPLVENAIKHGLEPKIEGGRIDVRAERQGGSLKLTVADTGLGLDDASAGGGTHVGVANVRARLHALYGTRTEFHLLPNTPSGVIARIAIPL